MNCEFSDMMFNRINSFCIFDCCWVKEEKLRAQQIQLFAFSFLLLPFILSLFPGGGSLYLTTRYIPIPSFLPSFLSLPRASHLLHSSSLPVLWKFRVQTSGTHSLPAWSQQNIYENFHLNCCNTGSKNKRENMYKDFIFHQFFFVVSSTKLKKCLKISNSDIIWGT